MSTHTVTARWIDQAAGAGHVLIAKPETKGIYVNYSDHHASALHGFKAIVVSHVVDDLWLFHKVEDGGRFQGQLCDFAELPE